MKNFADSAGLVLVHFCSIFADSAGLVLVHFCFIFADSAMVHAARQKLLVSKCSHPSTSAWLPSSATSKVLKAEPQRSEIGHESW